jgi:hypothetical protein
VNPQAPLLRPDERGLGELLDALGTLIAGSKSTWPGRIIVSRSKTITLLKLMEQRLGQAGAGSTVSVAHAQALVAVIEFEDLAANSRFYKGANIWETFYFYGPRKKFEAMATDLRTKLAPFAS